MNILKFALFTLLMCTFLVDTSAQNFKTNSPQVSAFATQVPVRAGVYPNPFYKYFTIYGMRNVASVALLDEDRVEIDTLITERARGIVVNLISDIPAGDYTVMITFKDGSIRELPIEKL